MRITVDANALDGEFSGGFPPGNNVAGGDFVVQFTVTAPVVMDPTLDAIQAAVFTPSCASSGCHSDGNQAAGLSLASANTSFLELVGEFSSQNGQDNVMLVAPTDPNASYLIRKMEGAVGITGARIPIGAPAILSQIFTRFDCGSRTGRCASKLDKGHPLQRRRRLNVIRGMGLKTHRRMTY